MIKCKNCNEFIGEKGKIRSFCQTPITEKDRKEAIREKEKFHDKRRKRP